MPGVLILEAMAQTGGVLLGSNEKLAGRYFFLAGFEKVKFRRSGRTRRPIAARSESPSDEAESGKSLRSSLGGRRFGMRG